MQKDEVGAKHECYDSTAMARKLWVDVCDGGTLKLRQERSTYFPQFPLEDDEDYAFRCDTATLFNLTRKSRDVMLGLMFQDPIELGEDTPAPLIPLWEDTDNRGTHGDVFWHRVAEATFEGYAAVFEDSPTAKVKDASEQQTLGLRPYSILYKADDIWNWRWRINPVSKRRELEMIVLRERTDESDGTYLVKTVTRFLHIFHVFGGPVQWQRFREEKDEKTGEAQYILEGSGTIERQNSIPVRFTREPGSHPLFLDIALKNIEHAQVYNGDYKNIIHKTCVPFPTRVGYEQPKDGQPVTNSVIIDVPVGGDFKMVEVAGTSIEQTHQALLDMREDISLMGLSVLADKTAKVDLTATEALLNNIGETAELRVLARNIQDSLEACQGFRAKYLGLGEDAGGSVVLGTAWNKGAKEKEEQAVEDDMMTGVSTKQAMAAGQE